MKIKLYEPFEKWYHGGCIYLYSDPHFQKDTEMEQFFKWPTAEERLARINKCVTKNDTFVCLGDVGDRLDLIAQIKCDYKVLITGNHDKGNSVYQKKEKLIDWMWPNEAKGEFAVHKNWYIGELKGGKVKVCCKEGYFDEVYDGPLFISDKILLSHERIDLPFCINIHGHEHCAESWFDLVGIQTVIGMVQTASFNIASDVVDFKPIRLDEIISKYPLKKVHSIHRITIDNATNDKLNGDE